MVDEPGQGIGETEARSNDSPRQGLEPWGGHCHLWSDKQAGICSSAHLQGNIFPKPILRNTPAANFPMHGISPHPSGFPCNALGQEEQDRSSSSPSTSTVAAALAAGTPSAQRGPVDRRSIQPRLLQQAGPSTQPQGNVQQPAGTALSDEELTQWNQATLAAFFQKADADPSNTRLTKDYWRDVLMEVADWLKRQTSFPNIRALVDLQDGLDEDRNDAVACRYALTLHFTENAATARLQRVGRYGKNHDDIISALHRSLGVSQIALPPSYLTRQDEWVLHEFQPVGLQLYTPNDLRDQIGVLKNFCQWLNDPAAHRQPIPSALDSLEKVRLHPKDKEHEINALIQNYRNTPGVKNKDRILAAVRALRKGPSPTPASSAMVDPGMQPVLPRQAPSHTEQSPPLAEPPRLLEMGQTSEEIRSPSSSAVASTSTVAAALAAGASTQRGPVDKRSSRSRLLRQMEPSTRPQGSGNVQQPAGAALSDEELTQRNRATLDDFFQKVDADPSNTPLTKDYWRDVLMEAADWLKQQASFPDIRSLADLRELLYAKAENASACRWALKSHFTENAAIARIQRVGTDNKKSLNSVISNLSLSLDESEIEISLPPSYLTRQDEWVLHRFEAAGMQRGKRSGSIQDKICLLKNFCKWLNEQTALPPPIPPALDSLEKVRLHPKDKEHEVEALIQHYQTTPGITKGNRKNILAAVRTFRAWLSPASTSSAAIDPGTPPRSPQQTPGQPEPSANLAESCRSLEMDWTSEHPAPLMELLPEAFDEQDDAAFAASPIPAGSPLDAQQSSGQPGQSVTLSPPHSPGLSNASLTSSDLAPFRALFEQICNEQNDALSTARVASGMPPVSSQQAPGHTEPPAPLAEPPRLLESGRTSEERCPSSSTPASTSVVAAALAAGASTQRGPVDKRSSRSRLLRQMEPSTRPWGSGNVQQPASAALSDEELAQRNRATLDDFFQKVDADPSNTPLTKRYWRDVLMEVADWLKRQISFPNIRSLADLRERPHAIAENVSACCRALERHFTGSGMTAHIQKVGSDDIKNLYSTLLKLPLSLDESEISLLPSYLTRQDEWVLHRFEAVGKQQCAPDTLHNKINQLKQFAKWLNEQAALPSPIPPALDSLEKVRLHPKDKEDEVDALIEHFKKNAHGMNKRKIKIAVQDLRTWLPPAPASSAAIDPGTRPALPQQAPGQPEPSANLAEPSRLLEMGWTSGHLAILRELLPEAFDEQEDAASAASPIPAGSSFDALQPSGQPGQSAPLSPPHSPGLSNASWTSEHLAELREAFPEIFDVQDDAASAVQAIPDTQPTLPQAAPSTGLDEPLPLLDIGWTPEHLAILRELLPEAFDEQEDAASAAPPIPAGPSFDAQQPSGQPGQSAPLSPPHSPGLSNASWTSEHFAELREAFPEIFNAQDDASSAVPHAPLPPAVEAQPHGVRRPAPESQDKPPAVRRRLDNDPGSLS